MPIWTLHFISKTNDFISTEKDIDKDKGKAADNDVNDGAPDTDEGEVKGIDDADENGVPEEFIWETACCTTTPTRFLVVMWHGVRRIIL